MGIFSLTLTGGVNVEVFVRDKYWFSPYGGVMWGFFSLTLTGGRLLLGISIGLAPMGGLMLGFLV